MLPNNTLSSTSDQTLFSHYFETSTFYLVSKNYVTVITLKSLLSPSSAINNALVRHQNDENLCCQRIGSKRTP